MSQKVPEKLITQISKNQTRVEELIEKLDSIQNNFQDFESRRDFSKLILEEYIKARKDKNLPKYCNGTCLERAMEISMKYVLLNITFFSQNQESAGQYLAYFRKFLAPGKYPKHNYISGSKRTTMAKVAGNFEVSCNQGGQFPAFFYFPQ